MFPILKKIEEKEHAKPFTVDYTITANGWRASGGIKYDPQKEKGFWGMLEMVVENILAGNQDAVLNESYTGGFSRYLRPVKRNGFTWRWEELDYQSSNKATSDEK